MSSVFLFAFLQESQVRGDSGGGAGLSITEGTENMLLHTLHLLRDAGALKEDGFAPAVSLGHG